MSKIDVTFADDVAEEIIRIDKSMQALSSSKLNEKAILLLVCKLSGENQTVVKKCVMGIKKS